MRTYSASRKTKDVRKRSVRDYILVGSYVRPDDPELAVRFDAVEAEATASLRQLAALYDAHRDANGDLPYDEADGYDIPHAEARYMTPDELARHRALSERLVELATLRECGCLVRKRIWLSDWTTSAMWSTVSALPK